MKTLYRMKKTPSFGTLVRALRNTGVVSLCSLICVLFFCFFGLYASDARAQVTSRKLSDSPSLPSVFNSKGDWVVYTTSTLLYSVCDEFGFQCSRYYTFDLNSAHVDGTGSPIKLSGTLVAGGSVQRFSLSSDDAFVVYLADQDTDGVNELYSVPIGGGTPIQLNSALVTGGNVVDFTISSDSRYVVYEADQETDNILEIYSVPINGGVATKLNGTLTVGGRVMGYRISPNDGMLVYQAAQEKVGVFELYSVPIAGGASIKLNGPLVNGGNVDWYQYQISPDSSRVVYLADQEINDVVELYSVAIEGGNPIKLNGTLFAVGGSVSSFQFSPNGNTVVYRSDQETDEMTDLYSVPIGGGAAVKLSVHPGGNISTDKYEITSDSTHVVYITWQGALELYDLYSVPIDGSTLPVNLNIPLAPDEDVIQFLVTPDSQTVVYRVDKFDHIVSIYRGWYTETANNLYSVPVGGGLSTSLNAPLLGGGGVRNFLISPDGKTVVYQASLDTFYYYNLFSVPLAGGMISQLNGTLQYDQYVSGNFWISELGNTVVYTTAYDYLVCNPSGPGCATNAAFVNLYSVPIHGNGSAVQVNTNGLNGGTFSVSPDGSAITYSAAQDIFLYMSSQFISNLLCFGSSGSSASHSADQNHDRQISLSELLRVIQFYNIGEIGCLAGSEDGFYAGSNGDFNCTPHSGDYNPQDWSIDLPELLRIIQLFNSGHYYDCPGVGEDGFCPCTL